MESIQALQQKRALLILELQLIDNKISFLETFGDLDEKVTMVPCGETPGKTKAIPELTAPGKEISNPLIADILLKDMNEVQTSEQVILAPDGEISDKATAIPEQTAPGKESTNPLMANNLPKVMNEVQTSPTLIKPLDFGLRPNGKNPVSSLVGPNGHEDVSVHTNVKHYYVVFNGLKAGIYTSWNAAEQAVKGVSGVKHRKYKSFDKASQAAHEYRSSLLLSPLRLISDESLRPTYAQAMASEKAKMTVLGSLPKKSQIKFSTKTTTDVLYQDDLLSIYHFARDAAEETFKEGRFFTTDKPNLSLFNFVENCDPELVKDAYDSGLIKTIYPGHNLLEIPLLPEELRRAVKNFRRKCIKDDEKKIFLKFTSTIPRWSDGEQVYTPHHHIQIGISKGDNYAPSKRMNGFIGTDDCEELAIKKIGEFISKCFNYYQDDKVFINLVTDKVLVVSSTTKPTPSESVAGILSFQKKMRHYNFGPHHVTICKQLSKMVENSSCNSCKKDEEPQKEGHVEDSSTPSTSTS